MVMDKTPANAEARYTYIARVQVSDSDFDYGPLHAMMLRHGFITEIIGSKRGVYSLPHAEYMHVSSVMLPCETLRNRLQVDIDTIANTYVIIVFRIEEAAFSLKQAPLANASLAKNSYRRLNIVD